MQNEDGQSINIKIVLFPNKVGFVGILQPFRDGLPCCLTSVMFSSLLAKIVGNKTIISSIRLLLLLLLLLLLCIVVVVLWAYSLPL